MRNFRLKRDKLYLQIMVLDAGVPNAWMKVHNPSKYPLKASLAQRTRKTSWETNKAMKEAQHTCHCNMNFLLFLLIIIIFIY